jgi:hypothetical protein
VGVYVGIYFVLLSIDWPANGYVRRVLCIGSGILSGFFDSGGSLF